MPNDRNKEDETGQGREFQDPLEIPIGDDTGDNSIPKGNDNMATADLATELMGQSMGQLSQTGAVAQNNFVTVNKALDYDFMEQRRMTTLDEAVGIREVASKVTPAGPSPA